MTAPGTSLAEKLGASAGAWATLYLAIHYFILAGAVANPSMTEANYARALVAERMRWESATALRVMAGIMIVWFMGSLAARLRKVEGETARLSTIAFGIGVIWGGIWLLSALFNSAAIELATAYPNLEGVRLMGMLATETPMILTPAVSFTLILATGFVTMRYGGYSKAYANATVGLSAVMLVLAIVEWYGAGNLGGIIMTLALGWLALTSLLTIQTYRA
jgi:hypothetical protein